MLLIFRRSLIRCDTMLINKFLNKSEINFGWDTFGRLIFFRLLTSQNRVNRILIIFIIVIVFGLIIIRLFLVQTYQIDSDSFLLGWWLFLILLFFFFWLILRIGTGLDFIRLLKVQLLHCGFYFGRACNDNIWLGSSTGSRIQLIGILLSFLILHISLLLFFLFFFTW